MSTTVDTRVVELKFDNDGFKEKTLETVKSLENVEKKINDLPASSQYGISGLQANLKNVDVSSLSDGINQISHSFSAMEVIAITTLANITNSVVNTAKKWVSTAVGLVATGGKTRALNIENAKFQLEGLGVAWQDIEDDINYGVKDTAYGLDAAAKAASQLVASSVQVGDEMKMSLRAISGVAAMTNSDYSSIADIFTTVASNGKLMTQQLRQMSSRGLNASAVLSKALGKTEAEINDMVSKGQIDFKTFAAAMDDAFGEHAKDANKTFSGAMSNVKAALSRLGAKFYAPGLESMRNLFNVMIPAINQFNNALDRLIGVATTNFDNLANTLSSKFWKAATYFYDGNEDNLSSLEKSLKTILELNPAMEDFGLTLPTAAGKGAVALNNIGRAMGGLSSGLGWASDIITSAMTAIKNAFNRVFDGDITGKIADMAWKFNDFFYILTTEKINSRVYVQIEEIFVGIFTAIKTVLSIIPKFLPFVTSLVTGFGRLALSAVDVLHSLTNLGQKLGGGLLNTFGTMTNVFEKAEHAAASLAEGIKKCFNIVRTFFATLLRGSDVTFPLADSVTLLNLSVLIGALAKLHHFIDMLFDDYFDPSSGGFKGLRPWFDAKFNRVLNTLNVGIQGFAVGVKAGALKDVSIAMLLFAASLIALSMVNIEKLESTSGVVLTLASIMVAMMAALKAIASTGKGISKVMNAAEFAFIGYTLTQLATAMLMMSAAVVIMSLVEPDKLMSGLGAMIGICTAMVAMLGAMKAIKGGSASGAITLIGMAVAVAGIAGAMLILSTIKEDDMQRALGALFGILTAVGIFQAISNAQSKGFGAGKGAGFALMAAGIVEIAGAFKILASIKEEEMLTGLGAFIGMLTALTIAMNLMPKTMPAIGAGLLLVGLSMMSVATAVIMLSGLTIDQLITGLIGLGGALLILAGAITLFDGALPGAAALALVGAGLSLLVPGILALSTIDIGSLVATLITLVGILGVFAATAMLLSPALPVMLALSAVLVGVGVGLAALSFGLTGIASLLRSFGLTFVDVGKVVGTVASNILKTIKELGSKGFAWLEKKTAELRGHLIEKFLAWWEKVKAGIAAKWTEAKEHLKRIIDSIVDPIIEFFTNMNKTIEEKVTEWKEAGANLLNGLKEGILGAVDGVVKSVKGVGQTIINTFKDKLGIHSPSKVFEELGENVVQGLALGLGSIRSLTEAMGKDFRNLASVAAKNLAKGIGKNWTALTDGLVHVYKAGKDYGANIVSTYSKMFETFRAWDRNMVSATGTDALEKFAIAIYSNSDAYAQASASMKEYGETLNYLKKRQKDAKNNFYNAKDEVKNIRSEISRLSKELATTTDKETRKFIQNTIKDLRKRMESIDLSALKEEWTKVADEISSTKDKIEELTANMAEDVKQSFINFQESVKSAVASTINVFGYNVQDLYSSMFDEVTKSEALDPDKILYNMLENAVSAEAYDTKVEQLKARMVDKFGMDNNLFNQVVEKGEAYVDAFLSMDERQLEQAFEYFERLSLTSTNRWIQNLNDQEDATKHWSEGIAELARRGLSEGLLSEIVALGDKGIPYMDLLLRSTEYQVGSLEEIYAGLGTEIQQNADAIVTSLVYAINNAGDKFDAKGITVELAASIGSELTEASKQLIEKFSTSLEEAAESQDTADSISDTTETLVTSLSVSLTDPKNTEVLSEAGNELSGTTLESIQEYLNEPQGLTVGANICTGITNGLNTYGSGVISAAASVAAAALAAAKSVLDINSPSKKFEEIGMYADKGFAIGIQNGVGEVVDSTENMGNTALDKLRNTFKLMGDMVAGELELNPTISPRLDISGIRSGAQQVNSMFGLSAYSPNFGMSGDISASNGATYNFTQNNYSPKSLSRIDIYRQTKNQFSMLKGV